ncbi:MAG: ABC transporter ATP-binding protein [gamma proteobacterium symbiont of Lucinoma myriamae]|nr:ABC transporter ATP-binding protein [gamma proteobacterium symbiont of Lucinoma myriamae]MCU7819174.1 ABC transporter ATP-binding protein [gamma proteobacterium symbiont of Lucinoma myriamae]
MNKNIAVKLQNISKIYKLYDKPVDRLKESIHPLKKKYHKDFYALKDINLEIKKGEVLGLVGVNGAGKSTLLKIIAGVITPTAGRINIHGKVNAILELGTGLKPDMTGSQNIKLSLQINGIEKNRENISRDIIDFADIGEHINQPVKTYSSGMKARLSFAIATSTDPDILIVDEVLAVGDVLFQRKCYRKIEKLFKDGKTVIFVSHSAQSVIEFCSRAVLLYDREIILDSDPKKVTDFYQKLVFSKNHRSVLDEINGNVLSLQKDNYKDEKLDKDFYLPDFKSKPIEYRNYDVDIYDIQIKDTNGRRVNVLRANNHYVYEYKIKPNVFFENLFCGMQIKTEKGQIVSACTTFDKAKEFLAIQENDEILVQFHFTCNMNLGIFFTNAGVARQNDNSVEYLNRIVDALVFKIEKTTCCAGLISLNINTNYTRLN